MICWFGSTDFLNVARKDLLASIVSANGLAVPVILPLHPVNSHPAAGFAVTVTVLPAGYDFVCGSMLNLSLIHISEPTRLGMISYAVFCLKKKKKKEKRETKKKK